MQKVYRKQLNGLRYFTFIFIAYLLLLSWQQCQDLAVKDTFVLDQARQIQTHETPDGETEDCSPFCICSCCHIFTVSNLPKFTVKNKYTVSTVNASPKFHRNNYSQQSQNSIWQPPKFNFTA